MKGSPRFHFALPFPWGVLGASFPEPPFCFLNPCRSRTCGKSGEARRVSAGLSCSRPLSLCSSDTSLCGRDGKGVFLRSQETEVGRQNGENRSWKSEDRSQNGEDRSRKSEDRSQNGEVRSRKPGVKKSKCQTVKLSISQKSECVWRLEEAQQLLTPCKRSAARGSQNVQLSNCPIVEQSNCQIVQLSNSPKV